MSIPLGAIQLSDHLALEGLDTVQLRVTQSRRTLYGVMVHNSGVAVSGGLSLVLVSENHITYAQLQAIRGYEASGEEVLLVHPRGSYSVRVTGNDLVPDTNLADPHNDPDLWYSGRVYLQTV